MILDLTLDEGFIVVQALRDWLVVPENRTSTHVGPAIAVLTKFVLANEEAL